MINNIPIDYYIWLSATLFTIGVLGVLYRRNAIIIFMCIELMLNAVNLLMVAFSGYLNDASGQVFVFFIMAVAAAEVAVVVVPGVTRSTRGKTNGMAADARATSPMRCQRGSVGCVEDRAYDSCSALRDSM